MKFFAVLFAFLAVQGWTSAASVDVTRDDLLDLIDAFELDDLSILDYIPIILEAMHGDEVVADEVQLNDPSKCTPYIQEAYNNAVEVRRILTEGTVLGKKVYAGLKKCKELPNVDDRKKCARESVKAVSPQIKTLVQAYKTVKPKVTASMDTFQKCLA